MSKPALPPATVGQDGSYAPDLAPGTRPKVAYCFVCARLGRHASHGMAEHEELEERRRQKADRIALAKARASMSGPVLRVSGLPAPNASLRYRRG